MANLQETLLDIAKAIVDNPDEVKVATEGMSARLRSRSRLRRTTREWSSADTEESQKRSARSSRLHLPAAAKK